MIGLALIGLALAQDFDCTDGQAAWLVELEASGSRRAYTCLAGDESAARALIVRAGEVEDAARVTRALAVWRLGRLDAAVTAPEARAYNPADRRLLLDGIKAHRGRASPAPAHLKVLEGLDWYVPDDRYTDARLTALDGENLAMLESPPVPEPTPEVAAQAAPIAEPSSGCGCAAAESGTGLLGLWLALSLSWRRRAAPGASAAPQRAAPPRRG